MDYDRPILSPEHFVWCCQEAERRYAGKVIRDEPSGMLLCEDADGVCHTDTVLRALSFYNPNDASHAAPSEGELSVPAQRHLDLQDQHIALHREYIALLRRYRALPDAPPRTVQMTDLWVLSAIDHTECVNLGVYTTEALALEQMRRCVDAWWDTDLGTMPEDYGEALKMLGSHGMVDISVLQVELDGAINLDPYDDDDDDAPPPTVDWSGCDLVEATPGKVSGAFCLKHSRMPVQIIVDHYDRGWSPERISTGWEGITLEQVKGVIAYARPSPSDAPPTTVEPS